MAALVNDRNELLYSASSRVTGATVIISSGVVNTLVVPRGATAPIPSAISLQANTSGYITPSFTWGYRFGNSGTFVPLTTTINTASFACDAAFLTAAGSNTLVQFKVAVAETTSNLGVNQTEYILSIPILREGADGTSGINSVTIYLYKRTTTNTAPTFSTIDLAANSTYTFTNGSIVGQPTGWSQTIPSETDGAYLWVSQARAASTQSSYAFANTQWTAPTLYSKDGAAGAAGINSAIVYVYQRSATDLTTNPGAADYSFSTKAISTTTLANGWLKTLPSTGTDPVYVCVATAASNTTTATIAATDWSAPVKFTSNGINNATVYLYSRNNNSTTPPAIATTGTTTYNFLTGAVTGTPPANWTAAIPAESNGGVLWVTKATAAGIGTTDDIANTEWGVARVLGQPGTTGPQGSRGSRQLYSSDSTYTSTYTYLSNTAGAASYAAKATTLVADAVIGTTPTTPIKGDTLTFSNPTSGSEYVYTITHDGTNWVTPGTVIDGSLLVTNSITAAKINSSGLSIKDSTGATILDAGNKTINSTLSISPVTGSGFRAGDLNWDASGNIIYKPSTTTYGKGVAMTPGGLVGHNGTNTTFSINSVTGEANFSGNITGSQFTTGAFTGYAWPAANNYGTYFGPSGILLGNANNNKYFQVTYEGNIYAPGFTVIDGTMTINQANVINTFNLAGQAVTVPAAATGTSSGGVSITVSLISGYPVYIIGVADGANSTIPYGSSLIRTSRVYVNGAEIKSNISLNSTRYDGYIFPTQVTSSTVYTPAYTGSHTILFNADSTNTSASLYLIQTKK